VADGRGGGRWRATGADARDPAQEVEPERRAERQRDGGDRKAEELHEEREVEQRRDAPRVLARPLPEVPAEREARRLEILQALRGRLTVLPLLSRLLGDLDDLCARRPLRLERVAELQGGGADPVRVA